MDFILNVVPWWAWLVIAIPAAFLCFRYLGFNATIALAAAAAAGAIYAKGRKSGVAVEQAKQERADTKARTTIHDIKEDVRSIPATPKGAAERKERFDRWSK